MRAAAGPRDEFLRDAAFAQHLAASRIQSLARSISGRKSIKEARMWLAGRVVTMSRDVMCDVLAGRTTMTLTQLYDFERALGYSVYARIDEMRVVKGQGAGRV